jgi:enamine deaminase RidA (YjgF/YER057c/UK114 family)
MSHLDFKSYPGVGQYNAKHFHYAQTVKVGDVVYISGQVRLLVVHCRLVDRMSARRLLKDACLGSAGWLGRWRCGVCLEGGSGSADQAGVQERRDRSEGRWRNDGQRLQGWLLSLSFSPSEFPLTMVWSIFASQLVTYTVGFSPEYNSIYVEEMRRAWPNHTPLWTDLGVPVLGDPKMLVEVEVNAHIPTGQNA